MPMGASFARSRTANPSSLWLGLIAVFCVFAGKSLGGLLSDGVGIRKMTIVTVPFATVCILLAGKSFAAGMAGQFLVNLTMPVTLYLLYRCLPNSPGFAFGLAASALWPGTLIGQNIPSIPVAGKIICVAICFSIAMYAILDAERRQSKGEKML